MVYFLCIGGLAGEVVKLTLAGSGAGQQGVVGWTTEKISGQGSTERVNFPLRVAKLKLSPVGSVSGLPQETFAEKRFY